MTQPDPTTVGPAVADDLRDHRVGPVGLEPTTRGLKGRRITTTVASTCDYLLTAVPTTPTSGPWLTSFHATNHATPLRIGGAIVASCQTR